jgi:4-amino-4-deoxy-L-arabinose transferase-like glycosyltransferase
MEGREKIRNAAASLVLILCVAFAARMTFLWDQQRKIPPGALEVVAFENETGNIAQSLVQGKGFGSVFRRETGPTAWLAPVYPLLLAGIFKMFGVFTLRSFFAAVFLNVAFSTAACVPIFYAGKRIAGLGVASGAAWLWAIFPNAIIIPFEWIWDTCLSALLAATILWATLKVAESQKFRDWCGYGLLWGVTLMTNPALGSLLPFLLGWAAYRARRQAKQDLWKPALAFGVVILCCLPWTVRNYSQFHRFVPLRSNFPFELWIGNNEIFDLHAVNAPMRITQYEEIREYGQLGENAFLQKKWEEATRFIRTHPGLELQLTVKRFVANWTGLESPLKSFRETDSNLARAVLLANFVAALGALLGIVALRKRHNAFTFPAAVFPLVFPCTYYVTHASLRYRHAIDPVVLLLTPIALSAGMRFFAGKKEPHANSV